MRPASEFETLYQIVFFSSAVALVLLERIGALRREPVHIARRWTSNIGLFLIGSIASAVVLPLGVYAYAEHRGPGPMSQLGLPFAAQLLLTFLLLDLWQYWQHRLLHHVPLLWRFHLVHHSDTQIDVTTSERHHPIEVLLAAALLTALVGALGLPASGLGLYLLTAAVVALYSHANLRLPAFLDRPLSRLIVTSQVHAIHHSELQAQTDSNYGSVLTVWDRLFGTYVEPQQARIPHFGLGYFHQPKDTGLLRVLQQPFLFRRDLSYPARDATPVARDSAAGAVSEPPRLAITKDVRDALLGGAVGCALVILVMWPTAVQMTVSWRMEAYQYAWLVLPMIVYRLGWHHLDPCPPVDPRPDFTGIFVVIVGGACFVAASLMNIDVGREFALVLSLQGIAMSALGWRPYWRLFPTLALLFFAIPSGDLLGPVLRMVTLKSIELFAIAANLPHSVDGFVIFIGTHRYIVVDACSGLSYVTLASFLGYCFGLLLYRSLLRIVALSLSGALIGIVINVLRVNSIVLIDWMRGSQMALTAHGAFQWVALFMVLGLLFYVLNHLKITAMPAASVAAPPRPSHPTSKRAPVLAGLCGLLIAGSAIGLQTSELRPPHEARSGLLPRNILGWTLADSTARWSVDPQGRTESTSLIYRRDGRDLQVVIIETLSPGAKLPEVRPAPADKSTWREKEVRNEIGCIGPDCVALLHSIWQRDKSQDLRHIYFAYSIGTFSTTSKLALRSAHGWDRLTGGHKSPRLIAFTSEEVAPDVGELAAAFQMVQAALKASGPD